MAENQTERRTLKYEFTADESHDLALQLAGKTKEKQSIEMEKSSTTSQYTAKLKEVTATCNKLSNLGADGFEHRDVECEIEYHKPEEGRKTITRKDTGKSWDEKMEPWEWNLFNQPEEEDELTKDDDDLFESVEEQPKTKRGRKK